MHVSKTRHISFFDTTLRDGEQAPGYALTIDQKIALAETNERLGMNVIETGFPISSPADFEATRQISQLLKKAKPCGFSRLLKDDIDACADSMVGHHPDPQIELLVSSSDIHIRYKQGSTREAITEQTRAAVRHAKERGFTDISLALEDATRADVAFLKELSGHAIDEGVTTLAVPDTVGCALPGEYKELISEIRAFVGEDITVSVHTHDDLGLAVANSLAGLEGGANEVQTTLCGIGERAGNCSFEEMVAILANKQHQLGMTYDIVQHRIHQATAQLAEYVNLRLPRHKSIIGENAFATAAGIHQQGVMKYRFIYEFMRAEDFGGESRIVVGRHSGRSILRQRLNEAGIKDIEPTRLDALYATVMTSGRAEDYNDAKLLADLYAGLDADVDLAS
ncbi:2-isopropylmalate synthase [Crossiella equi]|uniref:2-isopropylmalate synthase n=1 Tax=Crossiella equi TaxID=130796 RepID=A0ABS5A974_9PSEU|nr:pyruvate carboxyltransferase [Crossiella equi]MBP2473144.1 2-isopropylmalate synthase [Crossiella equi]